MTVTRGELENMKNLADSSESANELARALFRACDTIEEERALLVAADQDLGRFLEEQQDDRVADAHEAIHAHLRAAGVLE